MNVFLQDGLNPRRGDEPVVERFGWQFRLRDKVIQTENNYDKEVFNGDIGQVLSIDPEERELVIRFEERDVLYDFNELDELSLAYAITIHKSQGSEFPAVVVPLAMRLRVLKTPSRSPKANSLCERLIGSLRRECLDWAIPLSEGHLRSLS